MLARKTSLAVGPLLFALGLSACSSEDTKGSSGGVGGGDPGNLGGNSPGASGGSIGTGGRSIAGGSSLGGSGVGGAGTGGHAVGGSGVGGRGVGGSGTGGTGAGGVGTGGAGVGGTAGSGAGGASSGGSALGGSNFGGSTGEAGTAGGSGGDPIAGGAAGAGLGGSGEQGGSSTGGNNAGGAGTGGDNAGGTGTGGDNAGGTGTGGSFAGCTPGVLDDTSTCQWPDMFTSAPGDPGDCIGQLDGRWGSMYVTMAGQQYFIQVNEWGSEGTQTMSYGGDHVFKMVEQQADAGNDGVGAPTGYPSIFIGSNSKHTTTNSNLPKAIGSLTTVPTTWVWDDAGTLADENNNIYNAAYDVWFNKNESDTTGSAPTGGFLMVWLHDPEKAEPIGDAPAVTDVTIAGVDGLWDIWIGTNQTLPCISYVRKENTLSLSYDLNLFIQDAITRPGGLEASWYLTNIFAGFEIWKGGKDIATTAFCAVVN